MAARSDGVADWVSGPELRTSWLTAVLENHGFEVGQLDDQWSLSVEHDARREHQLTILPERFSLLVLTHWGTKTDLLETEVLPLINEANAVSIVNTFMYNALEHVLLVAGRMRLTDRISKADLLVFLREHSEEMGAVMQAYGFRQVLSRSGESD